MDGENNGSKPYEQMDDLGGFPPLFLVQHPYRLHGGLFKKDKLPFNHIFGGQNEKGMFDQPPTYL